MSVLIAIPARSGSKRVPRKNIKLLNGKPMIAYSIEAAIESKLTEVVWVCTDDQEIADISMSFGAQVFRIPPEMAADDVSSTTPCLALLDHLEEVDRKQFDYLLNLQPTSPLRNSQDIKASHNMIIESQKSFLVSATEIDPHFFHWALQKQGKDWRMYFGSKYMRERIYLEDVYRPNGAIKLAKSEHLKRHGNYFGKNLSVYFMPEERSIHVGTEYDFKCAEAMLSSGLR